MKSSKSFTLIELLVVIAIIGLISSIVLINFKEAREKARIAKALEFSQSVNSALGADAVGIWTFDEGAGSTAYDSSGNGNHCTINGATYTVGIVNNALSFDGVDDRANCGSAASLYTASVTVEHWVKPSGDSTTDYPKSLMNIRYASSTDNAGYTMDVKNTGYVGFGIWDDGSYTANLLSKDYITMNAWHHLAGTYDGSVIKLYVDGEFKRSFDYSGGIGDYDSASLYIGAGSSSSAFKGVSDEYRIYSRALTSAEIQKHYAEGLERHKELAIK